MRYSDTVQCLDFTDRRMTYTEGRDLQERIHTNVMNGAESTIIMVEHEPVYTVGRRAKTTERPSTQTVGPHDVPVIDADRGGKTTWHGPGQLTVYPIIAMAMPIDVIVYVRALEQAVMDVCAQYDVDTIRVEGRSGVWVPAHDGKPEAKICALGVRVARSVTLHGIGFNINPDLSAFDLERIIPCGITDAGVTSLTEETGLDLTIHDVSDAVYSSLVAHLTPLRHH
ncbi:lipoyl(octanoyl) transferase LipB [Actinomyces vulturis]|uniref:lipoyl(octanoyl) transferase LipB n=1 Tax=Actinomyces vulturis TaxID=1857645 RepID=UPI0008321839|nr:lipoyl(octanoyl) transferase LipB [Actinomyces vulturis]